MLPGGPEFGVKYTIIGPDGQRAVFNDDTDADYVGVLADVTGLDSPEMRENANDRVEADGGIHGDFWYGRRPVVLNGRVLAGGSAETRNWRSTKLLRATNAMREDGVMYWTPTGSVPQFIRFRRQQPVRITGGFNKDCQVPLVSQDSYIWAYDLTSESVSAGGVAGAGRTYSRTYNRAYAAITAVGQVLVTNEGSAPTPPRLTITGPVTNPTIQNATTGESITLIYTLSAGQTLVVDHANRTVMLNGTTNRYSAYDFENSTWWDLVPGVNDLRFLPYAYTAGASLLVEYRHAWI